MKKICKTLTSVLFVMLFTALMFGCGHEHDFKEESNTYTCTTDGVVNYVCSCGETKQESVKAPGHTEVETARVDSTCTVKGSITYTCSECNTQRTEELELAPHSSTEVRVDATCTEGGSVTVTCADCGYNSYTELEALGHDHQKVSTNYATCTTPKTIVYECSRCKDSYSEEDGESLGHYYTDTGSDDLSYIQACIRPQCGYAQFPQEAIDNMQEFIESIRYTEMSADELNRISEIYNNMQSVLDNAGAYNAELHKYEEGSDIYTLNKTFEAHFTDFENAYEEVYSLYQYAYIQKDIIIDDEQLIADYLSIDEYKTNMYSQYAGLWQKIYDSALREYFYSEADGWTEELIKETLVEYSGFADPEYVALSNRNTEIETEFMALDEQQVYFGTRVLELYEEFVSNNNKIAQIIGGKNEDGSFVYRDYMDYAYEMYEREYTTDDSAVIYENIVKYISPLFNEYYTKWQEISNSWQRWTYDQVNSYNDINGNFTDVHLANTVVNEFMKEISITCGGETATFYDRLQDMMEAGTLILGEYDGAYTWTIVGKNCPAIMLGEGYRTTFTFVHEFGHYMNMLYNDQSVIVSPLDLSETHSQGLEMLYLTFLESQMGGDLEKVYEYMYINNILNYLASILNTVSIDRFERAVYSGTYTGINDDIIMADGIITKDEYDLLFDSIVQELGMPANGYRYWRPVTTRSAGYYISYSVSLIGSLQMLSTYEELDEKAECYTKLISYIEDENAEEYDTYKEVLEYAGLYSYDDEELFKYLDELLSLDE